jgi:hypothetical protein
VTSLNFLSVSAPLSLRNKKTQQSLKIVGWGAIKTHKKGTNRRKKYIYVGVIEKVKNG